MAAASDDLWQAVWRGADGSKTGWFGNIRGIPGGPGPADPNMTSSRRVFMPDTFSSSDVESVTAFLGKPCNRSRITQTLTNKYVTN